MAALISAAPAATTASSTRLRFQVTTPIKVADDAFHALILGAPPKGSALNTLKDFRPAGSPPVDCEFHLKELGTIVVPGLDSSIFDCRPTMTYTADARPLPLAILRLPAIYVLLNQAMVAEQNNEETSEVEDLLDFETDRSKRHQYSWERVAQSLRAAAIEIATQIVDKKALRTRAGIGFMALAQANPNLSRYQVGMGLELATELLKEVRHYEKMIFGAHSGRFETVGDLAGLDLASFMRFPATTSKSVRLDMHLVLSGRGRCVHVHPEILKLQMEGDVDGDELHSEIQQALKRLDVLQKYVVLPDTLTYDNVITDFCLTDCYGVEEPDWFSVYEGLDAKNGIGETTNLFYRGMIILQSTFMESAEQQAVFWSMVNRPDLQAQMPDTEDLELRNRWFRHLSGLALMDGFHYIFEAIFDMRKDLTLKPIVENFLAAIRGQQPMDFEELSSIVVKGKAIDVSPLVIMWNHAVHKGQIGKPAAYVRKYPIINLFFTGKGATTRKKEGLAKILPHIPSDDPAQFIFDELSGKHFTQIAFNETKDSTENYEFGDTVDDAGGDVDDYDFGDDNDD